MISADMKSPIQNLVAFGLLAVLTGCLSDEPTSKWFEVNGATMGTTYSVKFAGQEADADSLQSDIDTLLDSLNGSLSTYQADSELSRFNASRSIGWTQVSPELSEVIEAALAVSTITNGAFDITVAPLVELWGFGPGQTDEAIPPDDVIETTLAAVDYGALHVDSALPAIRKDSPTLQVDLSAIAKGYAVDRIAALLESRGIADYLVEIGGELKARGRNDRGKSWAVAIEKPISGARQVQRIITIDSGAVATSGDYRNFFEVDDERYSHIVDPDTGNSTSSETASVTVLDPSAMRADALATGLMVMGAPEGYELAIEREIPAMFIVRGENGLEERATPEFESYLGESDQ